MDSALTEQLVRLELSVLDPETRATPAVLEVLLAPEFLQIGATGRRFTRADLIAALARDVPGEHSASGFECVELAPGLMQLRYQSMTRSAMAHRRTLRSSLWRHDGAAWRMVFHQGTPVPDHADPT